MFDGMLTLRHARLSLVNIVAFVDSDSRIASIGETPGRTRCVSMPSFEVLPDSVDLIQDECVVSTVRGWDMCVRPNLHLNLYVTMTMVMDGLSGMVRTSVTSIAGTDTSVLMMIIDVVESVVRSDITNVMTVSLNIVVMVMASMMTSRPAWELVSN